MAQGSERSNVEGIHRLTTTQEGILFHVVQEPGSGVYFQQFTCRLVGPVDPATMERAWSAALARHPAARSLFTWEGREHPLQVVLREVDLPFEVVDDAELAEGGDALERFLAADRARGFRLDAAPLMRITLARGGSERHRLVWSFHHIALDGWSMRILLTEVLADVEAAARGEAVARPAAGRFEDHVAWLARRDANADRAFWRGALAGFAAPTGLRVPAPTAAASGKHEFSVALSREATERLTRAARVERVTVNTALRGAWALVLAAHAGEDDVVFGATVSGRPADLAGVESIVGMFINTVPVRVRVDRAAPIGDWLRAIQRERNEASEHEHASLAAVQKDSELPAGTPLFDSILVFENHAIDVEADGAPGGMMVTDQRFVEHSNFPLAVLVLPGERLELTWIHDADRHAPDAIRRVAESVVAALESIADDPTRPVGAVNVLALTERDELRTLSSGPALDATSTSVLELFDAAVRRAPDAAAVLDEGAGRTTTYADLDRRSRALAGALAAAGVGRGDRVGLVLDRGRDMVVGILGALRAGAAYVPLDPDGPLERRRGILADVGASAVVTTAERAPQADRTGPPVVRIDALGGAQMDSVDSRHAVEISGDDLAYVLFTSGSTGRPKGVEVSHANLVRSTAARFTWYGDAVGTGDVDRYLLLSPYHFDSSVAGLFWTLCSGGALVLPPPGGERDVSALADLVARAGVTHTLCLPSVWELVLEVAAPGQLGSLRAVIVAGEACAPSLARTHAAALPDAALVNEYGPTEGTVWATAHVVDATDESRSVPIGRPIPGASVHLVDAALRPVPRGAPGEVLLGGAGVARGYFGHPERTAEAFVDAAPLDDAPIRGYRTGDLARWREDGALEFLGRVDGQVKVRGQRIELGEIEARLTEHVSVREAVVVARVDGPRNTTELAAYVIAATDDAPEGLASSLREHLASALPAAMVPRTIDVLDALPRTGTGKVDRGALPDPADVAAPTADTAHGADAPANETERTLLPIWRDVLGLESVPREASFYELGGDSLLSIRIIARAHREGLRVDPARFADRPTLAGMAAAAEGAREDTGPADGDADGPIPLTPIQRWFFALDLPEPHHWNQAAWVDVPRDVDADAVRRALEAVASAHEALRLRFTRADGAWHQEVAPAAGVDLRVVDGAEPSVVHRAAGDAQRGFDLGSGRPLCALLDAARSRVLVVAHHLVVDAVSWGVLTEDLGAALQGVARGKAPEVPRAPGFGAWVRRLERHARSDAIRDEIPHWLGLRGASASALDRAAGTTGDPVALEESVSIQVDERTTSALLRDVPPVYGTRILDLLLAALARAVRVRTGRSSVLFDLEAHGREPLGDGHGPDPSRVVGWLTSVHPVRLDLPAGDDAGAAIKAVKEQLRAVPSGGIGFGLLQHLRGDAEIEAELARVPRRELLFNYLGQRSDGAGGPADSASGPGDSAGGPGDDVGPLRSALGERAYPIEVNAEITGGRLTARWSHGRDVFEPGAVHALARAFVDELTALVDHCAAPEAGGRTPSDFPLAGLDQSALDRLAERLGED
ncbi:MAG: amino acid adenylation domain-containing protein [Planctomycetota bacterium]